MSNLQTLFRSLIVVSLLSFALGSTVALADDEASASPGAGEKANPNLAFELRPYLEYSIGLSIVRNQNTSGGDPPNPDFWGRVQTNAGLNGGGALGLRLLGNFRTEIAFGYHTNEVTNMAVRPGESRADGSLGLFTTLVNGYYEYDLADRGVPLIPYVGAGIGVGLARLDAETNGNILQVDDDDAVFTWNVMIGASYPISDVTEISLGYRYLATEDVQYKARVEGSGVRSIDSEYDAHDVTLGLRIHF